jgi:hypothetical protein
LENFRNGGKYERILHFKNYKRTQTFEPLINSSASDGWGWYSGWMTQEKSRKYTKLTYTISDLREDPRLDEKLMYVQNT